MAHPHSLATALALSVGMLVTTASGVLAQELCVSVGHPAKGWLIGGVPLTDSERLQAREGRNFGTRETVDALVTAVDAVHQRFPGGHSLVTGDLSRRHGGKLSPHLSHQSGRDADVGYYLHTAVPPKWFRKATIEALDLPRTWTFVASLMADGKVEYIFMDYRLQRVLHGYARDVAGLSSKLLLRTFAYPRGKRARVGIIRHLKGHRDHMHIRFRSPRAVANVQAYAARHGADSLRPVPRHATVKRGWTLSGMARKFRTKVAKLREWNGIRRGHMLHPGDRLIVGWRSPIGLP